MCCIWQMFVTTVESVHMQTENQDLHLIGYCAGTEAGAQLGLLIVRFME